MKKGNHVSRWRAWLLLVPLLAAGCKPRDLVCETGPVFQVLTPQQGAGAAPFSVDRPGSEVKKRVLKKIPMYITLKSDNRARTDWVSLGHIWQYGDVIYSPADGLARGEKYPDRVFPMRRFSEGGAERVRFGFRSKACRDPKGGAATCDFGDEELFLVAEMTCQASESR